MNFKKILVVGAGTMGNGIAQVCAQKGISVVLSDVSQEILDRAVTNIRWSVGKFIEKGKLKEDRETIMDRIRTSTGLEATSEVDLVIEAVFNSPSSRTRSSFTCSAAEVSPISSRNTVPPACSKIPFGAATAPVNAPRDVAEQLGLEQGVGNGAAVDRHEGPCARVPCACTARATSSLPVPLSPMISTGAVASAACAICL